jgi:hypothetical protein
MRNSDLGFIWHCLGDKVYMLGLSAVCWALWTARNKRCFEKKHISGPGEIIYSACMFMDYWLPRR